MLLTSGERDFFKPLDPAVESCTETNTFFARLRKLATRVAVLDIVAELMEAVVPSIELEALLAIDTTNTRHKVGIVLHHLEAEALLELVDLVLIARLEGAVHVAYDALDISTAVARHGLLDNVPVLPQSVRDLNNGAGAVIDPEGARVQVVDPSRQGAGVGAAGENPRGVAGTALAFRVKGKLDILRKVRQVLHGIVQSEVLERLGGEVGVRRAVAPVAVLNDNGEAADFLSH